MSIIVKMFIKKINPVDFDNMYGLKKPKTGGGQTYIDAAGVDPEPLEAFLEWGEVDIPSFEDTRKIHRINAYAIGTNIQGVLEFAPRNNRKNFMIARQTTKDRHPAWSPDRGFPIPTSVNGKSEVDSSIDITRFLFIFIILTDDKKYYAGFINSDTFPEYWPQVSELKQIFESDIRAEIIKLSRYNLEFTNSAESPFSIDTVLMDDEYILYSNQFLTYNSNEIDYNQTKVVQTIPPSNLRGENVKNKRKRKGIKIDRTIEQKNKTNVGEIGEKLVLKIEKERLETAGRKDLAEKVEWSSNLYGDGLGYDIKSFETNGKIRYIEVKSTTGNENTPFIISLNELSFSREYSDSFFIYRVCNISDNMGSVRYYILQGNIENTCQLSPNSYLATPK